MFELFCHRFDSQRTPKYSQLIPKFKLRGGCSEHKIPNLPSPSQHIHNVCHYGCN